MMKFPHFVVASLWLCACAGPDTPKMVVTDGAEDETGAGVPTTGTGPSGTTTTGGGEPPTRPAPPPFELPDGCGDGVKVEGQYDCFVPHAFEWLPSAAWPEFPNDQVSTYTYVGYDIEGDGRDELLALRPDGALAVIRYQGGALVLDEDVANDGVAHGDYDRLETRWDWTGDGRADLTRLGDYGRVVMRPNLSGRGLGPEEEVHAERQSSKRGPPYGVQGIAVPFDADGDGAPELLVSEVVGSPFSENAQNELVQLRREGEEWIEIGERLEFLPCGWIGAFAYGDFDEDGAEDVAILDVPQVCNGYPESADPEWYRVGVYLSDASLGVLRFEGWFAAGGAIYDPRIWADDLDGDGHTDLIVGIDSWPFTGLSVLEGRGDGSFEAGAPRDLMQLFPYNYPVYGRADLDGLGRPEWVVPAFEDTPWAIPFALAVDGAGPLYALNPPESGGQTNSVIGLGRPVADVNGDGVDDYLVRASTGEPVGWRGHFWMMSAP